MAEPETPNCVRPPNVLRSLTAIWPRFATEIQSDTTIRLRPSSIERGRPRGSRQHGPQESLGNLRDFAPEGNWRTSRRAAAVSSSPRAGPLPGRASISRVPRASSDRRMYPMRWMTSVGPPHALVPQMRTLRTMSGTDGERSRASAGRRIRESGRDVTKEQETSSPVGTCQQECSVVGPPIQLPL